MRVAFTAGLLVAASFVAAGARAQLADDGTKKPPEARETPRDVKNEVPLVGYTVSAFGGPAPSIGAAGFAGAIGNTVDATEVGGGGRVWGSPVDRLTLLLQVDRTYFHQTAPSAFASVRLFGSREQGWAGGAMVAYKADAFAELEGEVEGAVLLSLSRQRLHLDTNFVMGGGFEESEMDGEVKAYAGYDVTSFMRVGLDGRLRVRMAGQAKLPGDRLGDLVGGPELLFGYSRLFFAATGGPSTVGVAKGVGWSTSVTLGAVL